MGYNSMVVFRQLVWWCDGRHYIEWSDALSFTYMTGTASKIDQS